MRRTYISSEFVNSKINGTFNMIEESNFFGAKMLDVEDSIYIENQNIIYYQQASGEQIDLAIESSLPSYVYSSSSDKESNHRLTLDDSQTSFQKNGNTKWILEIELRTILENYLFATLKRFRTFEGIENNQTITNDINSSVQKYITSNVTNRYKFKKLDLYIRYKDLRNQNVLRYKNVWSTSVNSESNKYNKFQTDLAYDDSKIKIYFNQEKTSAEYTFEYFFNILFEKI
jgi:hypothetical protein